MITFLTDWLTDWFNGKICFSIFVWLTDCVTWMLKFAFWLMCWLFLMWRSVSRFFCFNFVDFNNANWLIDWLKANVATNWLIVTFSQLNWATELSFVLLQSVVMVLWSNYSNQMWLLNNRVVICLVQIVRIIW